MQPVTKVPPLHHLRASPHALCAPAVDIVKEVETLNRQLRNMGDAMRAAGVPLPDQLARELGLSTDGTGTGADGKGGAGARNGIKVSGGLAGDNDVAGMSPASLAALEGGWSAVGRMDAWMPPVVQTASRRGSRLLGGEGVLRTVHCAAAAAGRATSVLAVWADTRTYHLHAHRAVCFHQAILHKYLLDMLPRRTVPHRSGHRPPQGGHLDRQAGH